VSTVGTSKGVSGGIQKCGKCFKYTTMS